MTHRSHSNAKSDDTLLRQRRVKDTLLSELFCKTHCTPEDATKGYVFAEYNCIVILIERYTE